MKKKTQTRMVLTILVGMVSCVTLNTVAKGPSAKPAKPALELGAPFGDNAILQWGMKTPVWGASTPGTKVTVTFGRQTKTAIAKDDGRWRVTLDPRLSDKLSSVNKAPKGRSLTIVGELDGKKTTKTLKNILIGEVWLCSGQSNMAGRFGRDPYPKGSLAKADYPALRRLEDGGWIVSTPKTAGRFSRVGFCFARKVQREIMAPVGVLIAATGGSPIESWMRMVPEDLQDPKRKKPAGKPRRVTNYESKIAPLVGYAMRGALWYQGEGNANNGREYFLKMQSMIGDWRKSWGQGQFPFYFVQIAGIGTSPKDKPAGGDGRAKIRNAQLEAMTIKNTGMVVTLDVSSLREHPLNKYDVGIRLARWALHRDYGRTKLVPSGPIYKSCKIEGTAIRVSFDYAKNGLMLASKPSYPPAKPTQGAKMPWLSIKGKDGVWHWAEGKLDGSDLVVFSKDVKDPIAVRYAYTQHPVGCNLYNTDGLPASPFSTCGY
jgi:sialate O-acetylesterase